tara:strand:+ start:226 stop:396 length:171 start_codon:yes stop_codon:yes gene_type:complete
MPLYFGAPPLLPLFIFPIELPLDVFFFIILEEFGLFPEEVLPMDGLAIYMLSPECP